MKQYILLVLFTVLLSTESQALNVSRFFQSPESQYQFEEDFKDRYSGRKYNYEGKETIDSNLNPVNAEGSKYQNADPNIKEENDYNESSFNLSFINFVFIFALIAAVVYLLYILFNEGSSGLFSSRGNQKLNNFNEITSGTIDSIDIKSLIDKAEKEQDFRLAIRYYYILVLKTLSLKKLIIFEDDKTNAEYLNEIAHLKFSNHFAYASYLYNYIWYGEFPLSTDQYNIAKQSFNTLLNDVK